MNYDAPITNIGYSMMIHADLDNIELCDDCDFDCDITGYCKWEVKE